MGRFEHTQSEFWGGPWYRYWMLMIMTVLGGIVGLDHIFLRSPLTGIAKLVVNLVTFGLWYFYDIIQVFSEKDQVLEHGLSIPFFGGQGIARGMFVDNHPNEETSKSPLRYLGFVLLSTIGMGFDSLVAGDMNGAFAHFLCYLIPLLWPIGLVWTIWHVIKSIFLPHMLFTTGTTRIFPFTFFMDKEGRNVMGPVDLPTDDDFSCDAGGKRGFFRGLFSGILDIVTGILSVGVRIFFPQLSVAGRTLGAAGVAVGTTVKTAANTATSALQGIKAAVNTGVAATEGVKQTVEGVALGARELVDTAIPSAVAGASLVGKVASAGTTLDSSSVASSLGKSSKLGMLAKLVKQKGGGSETDFDMSLASPALLFLFGGILIGGAVLGFLRIQKQRPDTRADEPTQSKQSQDPRKRNDLPPKP